MNSCSLPLLTRVRRGFLVLAASAWIAAIGCSGGQPGAAGQAQAEQELEQLREENQELQRLQAENEALPRLRRDNEELQRLRGQVQDLEKLREENQQLKAQLQTLRPTRVLTPGR